MLKESRILSTLGKPEVYLIFRQKNIKYINKLRKITYYRNWKDKVM